MWLLWVNALLLLGVLLGTAASPHEHDDHLCHHESTHETGKDDLWHHVLNIFKHYFMYPDPWHSKKHSYFTSPSPLITPEPSISSADTLALDACQDIEFKFRFLVGLIGRPTDEITPQECNALEQGFIDTYSAMECGDHKIDSVTIVTGRNSDNLVNTMTRNLQDSTNTKDTTYSYEASGQCRNCQQNVRATGDKVVGQCFLEDVTTKEPCACPPPMEDEVIILYNEMITELWSNGSLINVLSINDNFSELEEVNCTSKVTEFEVSVSLSFQSGSNPTAAELGALAAEFVDSYNEANACNSETYDALFWVAIKAEHNSHSLHSDDRYDYAAKICGNCCGCPLKSPIYGKLQDQQSLLACNTEGFDFSEGMQYGGQQLQDTSNDACLCSVNIPESGLHLPTVEEFKIIYNNSVQFLWEEGIVTSISSIIEVTESHTLTLALTALVEEPTALPTQTPPSLSLPTPAPTAFAPTMPAPSTNPPSPETPTQSLAPTSTIVGNVHCEDAMGPLPVDGSIRSGSNSEPSRTELTCGSTSYKGTISWFSFTGTGRCVQISTCTDVTDFDFDTHIIVLL